MYCYLLRFRRWPKPEGLGRLWRTQQILKGSVSSTESPSEQTLPNVSSYLCTRRQKRFSYEVWISRHRTGSKSSPASFARPATKKRFGPSSQKRVTTRASTVPIPSTSRVSTASRPRPETAANCRTTRTGPMLGGSAALKLSRRSQPVAPCSASLRTELQPDAEPTCSAPDHLE